MTGNRLVPKAGFSQVVPKYRNGIVRLIVIDVTFVPLA
jgi:hypothetical protein